MCGLKWLAQIHCNHNEAYGTHSINILPDITETIRRKSTLLHEPNAQFGFSRVAAAPQLHIVRISQAHRKSKKFIKFNFSTPASTKFNQFYPANIGIKTENIQHQTTVAKSASRKLGEIFVE